MGSDKDNFNVADPGAALNAENRANLVNVLKRKLQDLAGQHSEVLESLSPDVRERVDTLREMQSQHDDLEEKYFEERAALEAMYQKLYQPFYTKRFEIVNAVVEVDGVPTDAETEEKGVPDFWLNAMKNNEVLAEQISERDEGALKFLKEIKWFRVDDPKGFKLEFYFESNAYFKNTVLTKTYHTVDEGEPVLEKATGTEIQWYPGKKLTEKIIVKEPKKKGSKNTKPITISEKCESFFNFFSPPQVPGEEDTADKFQTLMEQDYDVGSTIRDKIIPHAVSWFTREAAQDEYDDVEVDENDDEDERKNRKKKNVKRDPAAGDGQPERPPECVDSFFVRMK